MKTFKHTVARIRNKNGEFEGIPALTGENIYQMAVRNGYIGTEEEYLAEIITDGWVTGLAEVKNYLATATADGAVTTPKLANGAVTKDKLDPDLIDELSMSYEYGTEDLTAGTSELETGKLYFVYE